jgi:hypothetical protein
LFIAVNAYLWFTVHSIRHKVASFDEFLADDLMEASVFITCRLSLPKILTSAKLSEIFGSLRAYVLEEFEGNSSYLLLVGV